MLFASQTGNSEQAARDVCDQLVTKLPTSATCSHMQLDDFLELQQCAWTPVVIIISSSYGVGQAPLGGYRFRALCDSILANDDSQNNMLKGLSFCLLGLGDSKYRTYFENPTTIHKAMVKAGATLVGTIGKADASGEQLAIIAEWIDQLWVPLGKALGESESNPPSEERLLEMQHATIELCRQNDPDFLPVPKTAGLTMTTSALVALLGVLLATIVGHFLMSK